MRNPSLHITLENLKSVLSPYVTLKDSDWNSILGESFKLRIKNRTILLSNKKATIDRIQKKLNTEGNVEVFNGILSTVRSLLGHRFSPILKNSRDYEQLKEISNLADEFNQVFNLSQREGYLDFCKIGIELMNKKYALNKFKYFKEKIFQIKEWEFLIEEEKSRDNLYNVNQVIQNYSELLESKGIQFEIETLEDYVNFIYCKNQILENGAEIKKWLKSQFEKLEFVDRVPNPNQLYGEAALKRYKDSLLTLTKESKNKDKFYDPSKFLEKFKH